MIVSIAITLIVTTSGTMIPKVMILMMMVCLWHWELKDKYLFLSVQIKCIKSSAEIIRRHFQKTILKFCRENTKKYVSNPEYFYKNVWMLLNAGLPYLVENLDYSTRRWKRMRYYTGGVKDWVAITFYEFRKKKSEEIYINWQKISKRLFIYTKIEYWYARVS